MSVEKGNSHEGITVKHRAGCPARDDTTARCRCKPTYQAKVWSARERKRIARNFNTLAEAKLWRADAYKQLRTGTMRAPTKQTLRDAAAEWLAGTRSGQVTNRSGENYKPSTLRTYRGHLDNYILPLLGAHKLSDLRRGDLNVFRDRLQGQGLDGSTIRNVFMPLRAIFAYALERELVAINPTVGLKLPVARGKRTDDQIASPDRVIKLLDALPTVYDRALWATAFYAGLRRGELLALTWSHVDLAGGSIRVDAAWDQVEGSLAPKSAAGVRTVPLPGVLRDALVELRLERDAQGLTEPNMLVFGRTAYEAPEGSGLLKRAYRVWTAAGIEPVDLHSARHTYASIAIASGVKPKALQTYMGHASYAITSDRYGHLFPDERAQDTADLDAYLLRADSASRIAQLDADAGSKA